MTATTPTCTSGEPGRSSRFRISGVLNVVQPNWSYRHRPMCPSTNVANAIYGSTTQSSVAMASAWRVPAGTGHGRRGTTPPGPSALGCGSVRAKLRAVGPGPPLAYVRQPAAAVAAGSAAAVRRRRAVRHLGDGTRDIVGDLTGLAA